MAGQMVISMSKGQITVRTQRLFGIAGFLVRRHMLTTAEQLANEFGVNKRTIYRDIDDLRVLGLTIDGEAGCGYLTTQERFMDWALGMMFRNPIARGRRISPNLAERRIAAFLSTSSGQV